MGFNVKYASYYYPSRRNSFISSFDATQSYVRFRETRYMTQDLACGAFGTEDNSTYQRVNKTRDYNTRVDVYIGVSCIGNHHYGNRTAGIGVVFPDPPRWYISDSASIFSFTNQRAILEAAIEAIASARKRGIIKLRVYTCSTYLEDNVNNCLDVWKHNGWKLSSGRDVANQDLWKILDAFREGYDVQFKLCCREENNPFTEIARRLARHGANKAMPRHVPRSGRTHR